MPRVLGTFKEMKTRLTQAGINFIEHRSTQGDSTTYTIVEFNNGVTTSARSTFQLVHQKDKSFEIFANDGVNGWVRVARFEPRGQVTAKRSFKIEQPDQPGNSVYELYQDPGQGQTDVLLLRRSGTSTAGGADDAYTLLEIEAPHRTLATQNQEATLTLSRDIVNGSNVIQYSEFLDLFNNWYPAGGAPNTDMGIRIQRRGVGSVLREFAIQYASSIETVRDVLRIKPLSMDANGLLTDVETWLAFGRFVVRGGTLLRFNDSDNSHYIDLKAPAAVAVNRSITLPDNAPTDFAVLETSPSGDTRWGNGNTTTYKTNTYTSTVADRTIFCNFASAGAVTLPPTATLWNGFRLTIKRIAGAGNVNVTANTGQIIESIGGTFVLAAVNDSITLEFDGANWFVTARVQTTASGYDESATGTTLTGVTWSGVAPTGVVYRYRWSRSGNLTTVEVTGFGTAVQTSTGVSFNLPTNCPTPNAWSTNNIGQFAVSTAAFTNANAVVGQSRGGLVRTASGWNISLAWASGSVLSFACSVTYRSIVGTGSLSE